MRLAGAILSVLLILAIAGSSRAYGQLPSVEEVTATEVLDLIRTSEATVKVVNFWATWCIPCREEFPALLRLQRELGETRAQIIFISTDFPEDVPNARQFLAEHGVTWRTYVKTGNDAEFINTFHKGWSGALPATAVFGLDGTLIDFWEGKASYATMKERVIRVLDEASQSEKEGGSDK